VDFPEEIPDHFAGPARVVTQAEKSHGRDGTFAPFSLFPPTSARVVYTTNALDSVYAQLRKIIKDARSLPERRGGDEAAVARLAQHHQEVGIRTAALLRRRLTIRSSLSRLFTLPTAQNSPTS